MRRQLSSRKLGFVFADVVGGFGGMPNAFEAEGCLVLIKAGKLPLPSKLKAAMESDWISFGSYANNPVTKQREKTQSFKRAVRSV
jgi:hypothetical protein